MDARIPRDDVSLEGFHQILVIASAIKFWNFTITCTILHIFPSLGTDIKKELVDDNTILMNIKL